METLNKYFGIVFLLMGSFLAFLLALIGIFYAMKLLSFTIINIPGFDVLFRYVVTIIPYIIFFGGYYFLFHQTRKTALNTIKKISFAIMAIGLFICFTTIVFESIRFMGSRAIVVQQFLSNKGVILFIQLFVLFFCSAVIAMGEPKEADWMEKHRN